MNYWAVHPTTRTYSGNQNSSQKSISFLLNARIRKQNRKKLQEETTRGLVLNSMVVQSEELSAKPRELELQLQEIRQLQAHLL